MPLSSPALVEISSFSEKTHAYRNIGHDSFGDIPWINTLVDFVKDILAQDRVRIFGVCFGHQIVGRALGQRVYKGEAGWEVSMTPIELTEKGKEIFKVPKMVR
jgi:GMP synthase-like glutamine amidotransferase